MTCRRGILFALFASLLGFGVAGCASEQYVRDTTVILTEDVAALRRDLARFIEGHDVIVARRINSVLRQRRNREEIEADVKVRFKDASDAVPIHREALERARKLIAAERAQAEARAVEREALVKTQEKLEAELAGKLDDLVEHLKELSSTPSFKDRASFFAEYFKRTKKALDDAKNAGTKP